MGSTLDGSLLVLSGKGGVGKTTMAGAAGLLAAERGRRTVVVEVGQESNLPRLFGVSGSRLGEPTELAPGLSSITVEPDAALLEWLQALGGRVSGRVLASSSTFQYFAAAAPGARELVTMVKVWRLTQGPKGERDPSQRPLVVLDAPATGHALGMLGSPYTFGAIARVGPIAAHTRRVLELLEDPARSSYVGVAMASEMAVTELMELQEGLQRRLRRGLDRVIVNAQVPRRFSAEELARIAAAPAQLAAGAGPDARRRAAAVEAAVQAAHAVHERSRLQQAQAARLRRRGLQALGVPRVWAAEIDLGALRAIARRLEGRL